MSVRSFQVPATPSHFRLAAELAFGADFARHARHFRGEGAELIHHRVDGVLQLQNFAAHIHRDLASKDRRWPRPWSLRRCCEPGWSGCDAIELTESVRSFQVPATPRTSAWPPSLPSVPTSRATRVTSEANALSWSTMVLMVFFSSRISPRTSTVILRDRSPFATAVVTSAMLRTWLVRLPAIEFTRIGQILPGAGDAVHVRLAAELAFGSDFARHARHFRGEGVELVHHRVDGVLQLQNFAAHIHRDLARKIALRDGRGHFGDVANLGREVAGHGVHAIREIFPRAGDALHVRLAAELAFRADFARHARHFRRERVELIHHRVDGVLQLQNFAARRPP